MTNQAKAAQLKGIEEVTLPSFLHWLGTQQGTIECPAQEFLSYWGRCKGYRVSGSRIEGGNAIISHRYAYTTEHTTGPQLLALLAELQLKRFWKVEEVQALIEVQKERQAA